jgi:hypothetical protein
MAVAALGPVPRRRRGAAAGHRHRRHRRGDRPELGRRRDLAEPGAAEVLNNPT